MQMRRVPIIGCTVLICFAAGTVAAQQRGAGPAPRQKATATTAPPPEGAAGAPPTSGPQADAYQPTTFLDLENARDVLRPTRFGLSDRGGIGLIVVGSPYTLGAGEFAVALNAMNYDRHPGDVDIAEGMVQIGVGVSDSVELFFGFSLGMRTNSVNQDPLNWPVPPLDLFVDLYPTSAARTEPLFLYAQEVPYKTYDYQTVNIDPPGNGAHSRSRGNYLLGLKWNLLSEDRGNAFGFGIRPYVELAGETPGYNTAGWRDKAGLSGKTDIGMDFLLAKTGGPTETVINVGYEHVGDPQRGLRVQMVNSGAPTMDGFLVGEPIEAILDLRDRASFHIGFTAPVFKMGPSDMWFIGEFSYLRYIGGGTATERLVHPAEIRLGLQYNFAFARAIDFGFAWQLLLNDAGDTGQRLTNFLTPDGRGDINFGELVDAQLSEEVTRYFLERGATFSEGSSRVFATNNPAFDTWRNISTEPQLVVGQGGGAALFWVSWRVARLW